MAEAAFRWISKKLYIAQDAADLLLPIEEHARMFRKELLFVVAEKNKTATCMTGLAPIIAIKKKHIIQKSPYPSWRVVGYNEPCLHLRITVRYLLQPGKLEGRNRRCRTDVIWLLQIFTIESCTVKKN